MIDLWIEEMIKPCCTGRVELFRYADDMVICCQYERDAHRILSALAKRLEKYNLKLNQEKTRLVSFSKQAFRQDQTPASFNFLGFTFYWGHSRKGTVIPKLKSEGKRLRTKLKRVNEWVRRMRNRLRLLDLWNLFCAKLAGHIRYYGVSFNIVSVRKFLWQATRILFKWLNRRSQRKSFNWEQFNLFIQAHPFPKARIFHRLW